MAWDNVLYHLMRYKLCECVFGLPHEFGDVDLGTVRPIEVIVQRACDGNGVRKDIMMVSVEGISWKVEN